MSRLSHETVVAGLRAAIKLRSGELPTEADLKSAPLLTGWILGQEPGGYYRLGGFVSGHPKLADGWCWTSTVLFLEPTRRWARTVSRLYRLSDPLDPDAQ